MKHPSEKDLAFGALNLEVGAELDAHLAECEECAMRVKRLRTILARFGEHVIPGRSSEETSDIFAAAWTRSRRRSVDSPLRPWRQAFQAATVFVCGIVAGYFLFAHPMRTPNVDEVEGTLAACIAFERIPAHPHAGSRPGRPG